jgi:hypothetical protein
LNKVGFSIRASRVAQGAVEIDLVLVGRSNVECATNLKRIRAGFQAEKSRQALNPRVAQ